MFQSRSSALIAACLVCIASFAVAPSTFAAEKPTVVEVEGVVEPISDGAQKELIDTLRELSEASAGKKALLPERADALIKLLQNHEKDFGRSESIIRAAIDFVTTHDANNDYLFKKTRDEWPKDNRGGLRWSVFLTMQYLLDQAYTPGNLAKFPELLGSVRFATADYFPGPATKPADPDSAYSVKLWASFPETAPYHFWMWQNTARKPTGAYLAPGTIVTVTVPQSMVNKGFQIRIGAHANDLAKRPRITRLWRTTLLYPITSTEIKIASPLGGGIYLETPSGADLGEVTLTFRNIVRSPFFSNTRVRKTTLEDWQNVERNLPGPWADFQSEAFMMQLPRVWVYKLDDAVSLMDQWDKAVTAVVKMLGYSIEDVGREAFYIQPDTQLRNSVFSPGHPQVNAGGVEPGADKFNGYRADDFHLRGPRYAPDWVFHEWGHYVFLAGPPGEVESSNNFLHATALNWGLGVDMDEAFGTSRGSKDSFFTIDNSAINWMTGLNFSAGVMNAAQKSYQLKGHAKFADLARLFGWQTLADFYRTVNADRIAFWKSGGAKGEEWPKVIEPHRYLKRLSETSGVDMRPLFHFWGVPPKHGLLLTQDLATLEAELNAARDEEAAAKPDTGNAIAKTESPATQEAEKGRIADAKAMLEAFKSGQEDAKKEAAEFDALLHSGKVKRSVKIYDQLLKYKSLVPQDNAAFREYALKWYGWKDNKPPTSKAFWTERDHRKQWDVYNKESAAKIEKSIDKIVQYYFPDGRPKD